MGTLVYPQDCRVGFCCVLPSYLDPDSRVGIATSCLLYSLAIRALVDTLYHAFFGVGTSSRLLGLFYKVIQGVAFDKFTVYK